MTVTEDPEPWLMVNDYYKDILFIVEGRKLFYHKAILTQHSRLVRQLLTEKSWCNCQDVVISLDDVSIRGVKYVLDLIYSGYGNVASGDIPEDFKTVIDMLQIDTIVTSDVYEAPSVETSSGGLQEFLDFLGSERPTDAPVTVNPEDLLVTRNMTNKSKVKRVPGRNVNDNDNVLDNAETLRSLRESKGRLSDSGAGFKKKGRKKKPDEDDEASSPARPEPMTTRNRDNSDKMSKFQENITKSLTAAEPNLPSTVRTIPVSVTSSKPKPNDMEIILDEDIKKEVTRTEDEKFVCPYSDCLSESKNAQSIKIHLALVHYKKTIQAEFPNWKKQKCEECDRSIGQMTAYYLHMANHKKYKYMDLTPDQLRANSKAIPAKNKDTPASQSYFMDMKNGSSAQSSSFVSANKVFTPKPKSFSPQMTKSNSFVKTVNTPSGNGNMVGRSSSFVTTTNQPATIRTPLSKFIPAKSYQSVTPAMKGPPGPMIRMATSNSDRKPMTGGLRISERRESFGGTTGSERAGFMRSSNLDREGAKISLVNKDNKKQRGF